VTGSSGNDYGAYANGAGSKFTNVTIGDTNDACFFVDTTGDNELWTTVKCHGSSNSKGIDVNSANTTFNGFDINTSYDGCAVDESDGNGGITFKNGHCGRVLNDAGVYGSDDPFTIDTVSVDAALDDCFAYYQGGNAVNGTLKNSTGVSCGTGTAGAQAADWEGTGTNLITGNDLRQSPGQSLLVATGGGGAYTVTNNKFHDAQFADCVTVNGPVETLTMTGNKAQMCYESAFFVDVNTNPIVKSNTGNDASGLGALPSPTMGVLCEVTCDGGQVVSNLLDGGGSEQQGLLVTNNGGGDGLLISTNTVTNMTGTGIEVDGNGGNTLTGNVVTGSSDVDDLYGIFLNSDGNSLTGSNVSGGVDNGIEVDGDGNILNGNKSHDNGEDGIHIRSSATNTVLGSTSGNTTNDNNGEGTEDESTGGSTIDRNSSTGNRQDCAGAGNGTYGGTVANLCSDGSTFADPGNILAPVHHGFSSLF
jgi:hypothetical protein